MVMTVIIYVAVTKLVADGPVEFEQPQYVVEVAENTVIEPLLRLTTRPHTHGMCSFPLLALILVLIFRPMFVYQSVLLAYPFVSITNTIVNCQHRL